MAQLKLFFVLVVFPFLALAENYFNSNTKIDVVFLQNVHVSKACKFNKSCLALQSLDKKKIDSPIEGGLYGHPASRYCKDSGGTSLILKKNKKGDDFDFCQFKDQSVIDSWDLYYRHHAKSVRK